MKKLFIIGILATSVAFAISSCKNSENDASQEISKPAEVEVKDTIFSISGENLKTLTLLETFTIPAIKRDFSPKLIFSDAGENICSLFGGSNFYSFIQHDLVRVGEVGPMNINVYRLKANLTDKEILAQVKGKFLTENEVFVLWKHLFFSAMKGERMKLRLIQNNIFHFISSDRPSVGRICRSDYVSATWGIDIKEEFDFESGWPKGTIVFVCQN